MNFSIIMLSCTKQQIQLILSTVKTNGLRPSPASVSAFCLCKNQERAKATITFALSIILYCYVKFEHHLGTKVSKITVVLSYLICKKISSRKEFHGSRLFDIAKYNTIFYIFSCDLSLKTVSFFSFTA